ncbi:hypothetical protein ACE6H2_017776 [Prunus campanulata]
MECNKDEALKAKEVAELKAGQIDFPGAKRFALKAQNLYPELDGISQFLATLDVYISAEKRANGVIDWYKVLGVEPLADEDTIRKQYRKLALILHPDKNKSVGADGAFKIVKEAWSLLSNKAQRILYDQKLNFNYMHERAPDGNSSIATNQNGFHNFSNYNHLNARMRSATHTKPFRTPYPQKTTFWTVCNSCKMHFEYLRAFLNHNLYCHNCHRRFLAYETPPPPINENGSSTSWTSYIQQQNSSLHNKTKNSYAPGRTQTATTNVKLEGISGVDTSKKTFQAGIFFKSNVESVQLPASSAGQAAGDVQPAFGQLKRGHEEAFPHKEAHNRKNLAFKKADAALATGFPGVVSSSVPNKDRTKKKRHLNRQEMATQVGVETGGVAIKSVFGPNKGIALMERSDVAGKHRINCTRELSQQQMRSMLMEVAKKEIHKKLNIWNEAATPKTSFIPKTADNNEVKEKEKEEAALHGVETDVTGYRVFVDAKNVTHGKRPSPATSGVDSDVEEHHTVSMTVPDPDFHDFDKDRTEKSFGSNQVWAVYDEDDGMPRYYAMVHSVISLKPFRLRISWLNSKSNSELAPLNWIACGFPKTSGELRIGKHEVYRHLPSFSHKVRWTKGTRGAVRIYPAKGDVWALYRNWSPDWNEHTPDEVIHKYDMVQVLEDYNEERGVSIVPLDKVAGFKTVFRQHLHRSKTRTIPREEMFRFSHQVPSVLLTGHEGPNAPKDCLELDPAATPLELLQVKPEACKDEMEEIAETCNGEYPVGWLKSTKEEALVENGKITIETGLVDDPEKKDVADMMKREEESRGAKLLVYSRRCFRKGKMEAAK